MKRILVTVFFALVGVLQFILVWVGWKDVVSIIRGGSDGKWKVAMEGSAWDVAGIGFALLTILLPYYLALHFKCLKPRFGAKGREES